MKRGFRRALGKRLPTRLRETLELFVTRRGGLDRPAVLDRPPGSRVLVLAPHPDDEIIGCGGALHAHHLAGHPVAVVYLTDGRHGHGESASIERTIARRRDEAHRAAEIIGIDRLDFLGNEDGKLTPDPDTVDRVLQAMQDVRPDIIYAPFMSDRHPDHLATNEVLVECSKAYADFMCFGYEVWTPLLPNCAMDISDVIDVKKRALEQFESQTEYFDLVGAFMGLSRYRSVLTCHGNGHAECFYRCRPEAYARLWKQVAE